MRVCDNYPLSLHIYFIDNYAKWNEHMARRKKSLDDIEQVDYYEEAEDGFSEEDIIAGTVLSSFSFASEPADGDSPALIKPLEFRPVTAAAQNKSLTAPTGFEFSPTVPNASMESAPAPKGFHFQSPAAAAQKNGIVSTKAFVFSSGKATIESLIDTRKAKTEGNVATPSVDGEAFSVGRYYKLRYSTAKMLNKIKAGHMDVNVYMNSIVNEAIRWYYGYLFGDGKG
jgi:hypothetical protein